MKTIYISGGMSGLPQYNHPAFYEAETRLALAMPGCEIINPARNDIGSWDGLSKDQIWQAFMRLSVAQVARADLVVLLDGWEKSKGACAECDVAWILGIETTTTRGALKKYGNAN